MRLAFVTMVWRDYWLLEKWVAHNSQWVPKSQLYVLDHGGDPKVAEIAEGCNVIYVPRESLTQDLTRRRWTLLAGLTNGMLGFYDKIICTDVDELLFCATGAGDLYAHLSAGKSDGHAIAPVGLNLIPTPDDATDGNLSVLQRHPNALLSPRYTKPCIVQKPVEYTVGGHGLMNGQFEIDPNVVLCHLHYVTPDYAARMADRQDIVAQSIAQDADAETPENFWKNWSDPAYVKNKEFTFFAESGPVSMTNDFEDCARILRTTIRHAGRRMVLKPRQIGDAPRRVLIPEKFRSRI